MRKLYRYTCDCGRMGNLEGLFIADPIDVENTMGKDIRWGEVLGKHSDIVDTIDDKSYIILCEDQEKINWLQGLLGNSLSGFNPIERYLEGVKYGEYDENDDE